MTKTVRTLLILASVGIPGLAVAAPPARVHFSSHGKAAHVADHVYGSFLRSHPKARIEAARIGLWRGHAKALAVRFIDSETCTGKACHTVVLESEGGRWHEMMAQRLVTLSIMPHPAGAPANLLVDGKHVWQRVAQSFLPQIQSYIFGPPMVASKPLAAARGKVMSSYLGTAKSYVMQPVKVGGKLGTVDVVQPSGLDCGEAGCPMVVFGNRHAVLSTTSPGLFGLAPASDTVDGVRGLVVSVIKGLDFYRWDPAIGKFSLTRTSYTSSVTPVP